jgi:hypothetical protein
VPCQTPASSVSGLTWSGWLSRANHQCSPHWTGNWGGSWARYTSTDPQLQSWTLADPQFITHPPVSGGTDPLAHIDAAAGALFNPIPVSAPTTSCERTGGLVAGGERLTLGAHAWSSLRE